MKRHSERSSEETPSLLEKIKEAWRNETARFAAGLLLVLFTVYLLLAFSSFLFTGAADHSLLEQGMPRPEEAQNYAGAQGAKLGNFLFNDTFGFASIFLLIYLGAAGVKLMRVSRIRLWKWFLGCSLLLVWFSIFLGFVGKGFYEGSYLYWGGRHGYVVSGWLTAQIGAPGLWLLLLATGLCFLIYLSAHTIVWLRKLFSLSYLKRKEKSDVPQQPAPEVEETDLDTPLISESVDPVPMIEDEGPKELELITEDLEEKPFVESIGEVLHTPLPDEEEAPLQEETFLTVEQPPEPEQAVMESEPGFEVEVVNEEEEYKGPELEPYDPTKDLQSYRFPTIDLMRQFDNDEPAIDMEEQNANKNRIINTLRSFGIEISSIKATVGPTVTLYEITPEQGVRISKIRGLEDDIALSLSADGIRIIAPIPGKGTIGIEVPNKKPKIVSGQSVIGSRKFQESTADLPIVLGKTITNEVFTFDLCKAPHVLVAGATGQGKSVGLNAIITSLLYKKHPAELKFVLIDPKKVEFSIYSVIENHFLAKLPNEAEPIITDVTRVVQTLSSLCVEMDTRYDLLKAAQVRNVKEYNEKFVNRRLNPEKGHRFMPYIVVVIDEFGDLIMTAGKEVELPIARIAQLARAVGIHMIIATQRPTTNIITGTIKANFPTRIAFRVSGMIDSRTILDRPGANRLIGKGDMLYLQGAEPVRVQCAFIDTPEVEEITRYIARQQGYPTAFHLPEYVGEESGLDAADIDMSRLDPLFEEAARLIVIHQQGSTSLIQRKLSLGYNRAGRIMDQLERAGVVGPTQGSKARDVLCVDELALEHLLNNLQ